MQTIDITPTWQAILPVYFTVLADGNAEGKKAAREELKRMAYAADLWNKHAHVMLAALRETVNGDRDGDEFKYLDMARDALAKFEAE